MTNLNTSGIPQSWGDCLIVLNGKDAKKVAHNTWLFKRIEEDYVYYAIRYHNTDIAEFYLNGDIHISNGGWDTSTTKSRLNAIISRYGLRITQTDYQWYLNDKPMHGSAVIETKMGTVIL